MRMGKASIVLIESFFGLPVTFLLQRIFNAFAIAHIFLCRCQFPVQVRSTVALWWDSCGQGIFGLLTIFSVLPHSERGKAPIPLNTPSHINQTPGQPVGNVRKKPYLGAYYTWISSSGIEPTTPRYFTLCYESNIFRPAYQPSWTLRLAIGRARC